MNELRIPPKDCVGVDNKRHIYFGSEDNSPCGMKIKRKKKFQDDWKLFCCYECTYLQEKECETN